MTRHSEATAPLHSSYRQLAAQMAATHAQGAAATWDAAGELLNVAKTLFASPSDGWAEGAAQLMAGVARLLGHGPFPAVPLHAAKDRSPLPPELRPDRAVGPPEEDVLLHALAYATPAGARPWPGGHPDPVQLSEVLRTLTGAIPCRMAPLRAAALRYLLVQFPAADELLRHQLLRRAIWLLDPRTDNPLTLLSGLTAAADPLVIPLVVSPRGDHPTGGPAAFTVSDWARWERTEEPVHLSGRIQALRTHRHLTFADLHWDGRQAQLALLPDQITDLQVGDLITARGKRGASRTGQATLFVEELEYHQPGALPDSAVDGLSAVLGQVRGQLADARFAETISPVLAPSYFGGAALPFTTWAAAAEQQQYLRVTTEMDLLHALSTGVSRCYEIGPSFRNEGLRGRTTKEFLMLEAYAADLDLDGLTDFVVSLVRDSASHPAPLRTVTFDAAFQQLSGIDPGDSSALRRLARELVPVTAARTDDPDLLARRLWRSSIRSQLRGLTLVTAIPGPSSPLIAGTGRAARRVWLYADGIEIAEISRNERDPATLARSFSEQFERDPHPVHRDYRAVVSLFENGVPPCVGVGLSLTRLAELSRQHTPPYIPASRRGRTYGTTPINR